MAETWSFHFAISFDIDFETFGLNDGWFLPKIFLMEFSYRSLIAFEEGLGYFGQPDPFG